MRKVDYNAIYDKSCNYWLRVMAGGFEFGLSDWGQYLIGNITTISELPAVDQLIQKEDPLCLLESHKASNEIIAPFSGRIVLINPLIVRKPSLINSDCYGTGWIFKLSDIDEKELLNWDDGKKYEVEISGLFRK